MKNISENEFYGFWTYATNLPKDALLDGSFHITTSGFYLERNPLAVYLFNNLLTGSTVLIANECHVEKIHNQLLENEVLADKILQLEDFRNHRLEFDDLDFFLISKPEIKANDQEVIEISNEDQELINNFYAKLSEDDIDTLDLDFENNTTKAWAVIDNENKALAIGRYYLIPTEKGTMDITLATIKNHRGKGYASKLLNQILSSGINNQNIPRYRVKTDNISSIKVAEKLGFKKFAHIQALLPR